MKGAFAVIQTLIDLNVKTVFGYPGGAVLSLYDALFSLRDQITHIETAHEQGAAHAADGYARASGEVGVCIATSGPGATNLVTGIATAYMDSIPLLAITGNVPLSLLGRDSFQEVDITGITMPITKHNYIIKHPSDIVPTLSEAFSLANSGRKGPVLVDIPKDILEADVEYTAPTSMTFESCEDLDDLKTAVKLINEAKRPVIFAGGGIISSGASAELTALSERCDIPVALSMMGLGGFPSSHPNFIGMLGIHGNPSCNLAVKNCDLVIAVGTRFSDRVTAERSRFAKRAKVIHIDIDNAETDKNIKADSKLIGDAKALLSKLAASCKRANRETWLSECTLQKEALSASDSVLNTRNVLRYLSENKGDRLLVTDVGVHQVMTAQECAFDFPRTFITSGGLGTMGFGLGAAIGACIATGKPVTLITGDGSFRMNCNELSTLARLQLPISILLINNRALAMVRHIQKTAFGGRFSQTELCDDVNYVALAAAYNIPARTLNCDAEIETVLSEALFANRPFLVECVVDRDEAVVPNIKNV